MDGKIFIFIEVILPNILAWRIIVELSIGLISGSFIGLKIERKQLKSYLNISNAGCYTYEDECYTSMLNINLAYHIIVL